MEPKKAVHPEDIKIQKELQRQTARMQQRRLGRPDTDGTQRVITDLDLLAVEQLSKSLASAPSTVKSTELLQIFQKRQDQLRHMTPETIWQGFQILRSRKLTARLEMVDWHRLLQHLVGRTPFTTFTPPEDRQRAFAVLKEIKQCGRVPDSYIYASLIRAVKDDMKQIDAVVSYVKSQYQKASASNGLSDISGIRVQKSTLITQSLLVTIAESYLHRADKTTNPSAVIDLYEQAFKYEIKPSAELCIIVLEACKFRKDEVTVNKVHDWIAGRAKQDLMQMTPAVYTALVEGHGVCGHWEAVERLFDRLERSGLDIPAECYRTYIRALAHLNKPHVMTLMHQRMDKKQMTVHDDVYALVARAYAILGRREELVQRVHKRLVYRLDHPDKYNGVIKTGVYKSVVEAYALLGDCEGVKRAWHDWKRARGFESERERKIAEEAREERRKRVEEAEK
ncbi:hypothetical protein HK097_003352, partial [Rhizophlyctis rosea]